ncbi:glycosyltransferase family 4 protein [Photobacterium carnosum]|uniref:glycosyltransferase family 4 protein n=1 Tax=Photobacterium carnosum TaxID=2023717 RepID=UPI001E4DDAAF|nr:glycosyltransferase family 4 protein [Photobacterium carnosum]MCD9557572.1 glycosyltransferase family 4 protein [Photobacterium carnosum]
MKNKVFVFTKYGDLGASSRLRFLQYISKLEGKGIDFIVCPLFCNDYINKFNSHSPISKKYIIYRYFKRLIKLFHIKKGDILWIEKEIFPYCPSFAEAILSLFNIKYIIDYDDAIFHNYDSHRLLLVRKVLGKKIDKVMKYSHHVVTGNSYLADRALLNNKNCTIIPTVVEPNRYLLKEYEQSPLVIGWIGSPSTQKYLIEIKDILCKVCHDYNAKLLFVGASKDILKEFDTGLVTVTSWSEENESYLINKMSIGIMPLEDGKWEKGKCGYKLIQYMASGLPVIGSNIGVNKFIIESSNSGFAVNNDDEWLNAFNKLLSDKRCRDKLGLNGRNAVINKFSVDSQVDLLFSVLSN